MRCRPSLPILVTSPRSADEGRRDVQALARSFDDRGPVDLNSPPKRVADWNHVNAVAYHPELDQIVISVHDFGEIWVIDHSTTTDEAAGHQGGTSNMGGDILYRWGNPAAYRAGTPKMQRFYGQHDAQWIAPGLSGEGHILVFNNGMERPGPASFSTVDEIVPPVDADGVYQRPLDKAFGPKEPVWIYKASPPTDFYSMHISGAQRLPNGNTLICSGANGTFFEVTPDKQVVWRYVNPVTDEGPLAADVAIPRKGDHSKNEVFKVRRYSGDYPGLAGRDLSPGDRIELPAATP